jgi:putative ABC transport system permease protein
MQMLWSDVKYAVRMWSRSPGFVAVAALTLALGIGANTTMFSIVNATLLRPLPFPESDRLTLLWQGQVKDPKDYNIVALPNYRDWLARNRSFADIALFDSAGRGYNLTSNGEPEQVSGLRVTASFFKVLGVAPMLGRTFVGEEEQAGRDRVVVLSYGLWTRRYGADRSLVGKTISIDSQAYTVAGVMPATFQFQFWSGERQLWVPAGWTVGDQDRGSNSFIAIGRLKPGVTFEKASAEMDVIGRALAAENPENNTGETVRLEALSRAGLEDLRPTLTAMLAVVGFVLLIACVNVANLMLARGAVRARELAIRCAIGASRGRIVRQLLTESVALSALGGSVGLFLAVWGTTFLVPILPGSLRYVPLRPLEQIAIDKPVLLFTSGVTLLSGILFGLAPAIAAFRSDLNQPLKDSARGSTGGGRSRLRHGLVAAEVALTLVVLAGAGVMIASVARLLNVDPGLDPKNVLVMEMSQPQEDLYYGPPEHLQFCQSLETQVGSVPGVQSVSAIAHLPLSGGNAGRGIAIEGLPDPGPGNRPGANYSVACPGILRTLGIPLRAGREFTQQDTVGAPGVVLINESMAKRFWPNEQAVGKRFQIGSTVDEKGEWCTVVGVFADIHHSGLDRPARPLFLRPFSQAGWPFLSIVTKTASAPAGFVAPIKQAMRMIEPTQPVTAVDTMENVIGDSVSSRRFPMIVLSLFALLALGLSAVGIAGVVGYSVVQRTKEIGIRVALGARPADVLRLVIGHSLAWTLLGVGAGLAASFGLLRYLATMVYGVTPTDPLVLGSVSSLLITVALAAAYLPARRAARVDPVSALRQE